MGDGLEIGKMTQEKKKEDMTLEELLESLLKLTPEQEAMLDEHGDWIVTPENRKSSFTAQKTTLKPST
ncbi:MAG: hypothetical protein IPI79_07320 [Moraxellaceae bacterium]|nr:hypothetical protein [Moraxellaceae bacterium]